MGSLPTKPKNDESNNRRVSNFQLPPGPALPVVPAAQIGPQQAVMPPQPPPLPSATTLHTNADLIKKLSAEPFLIDLAKKLLDAEAVRLGERPGNTGDYKRWTTHSATIRSVVAGATRVFKNHLHISYPGLPQNVISEVCTSCIFRHHNLGGDENYYS